MILISKISIRFFDDKEVRAVWDDERSKWWFSALDIIGVLRDEDNYAKNRNCWKYLKAKLIKENNELVSVTNQLKLPASDGKSKSKAYALFDSSLLNTIEIGTVKGLQQIHGYLFGGLNDFAGQIRTLNIAKSGFQFALARFLPETLKKIQEMPESSFDEYSDVIKTVQSDFSKTPQSGAIKTGQSDFTKTLRSG